MELTKVISTVLGAIAPLAKKPAQRHQLVIKVLKACDFDVEHPPVEFSGIYAYALVEYGLAKADGSPEIMMRLLAEKEIKAAFRTASSQGELTPLMKALDSRLNWQGADADWNKAAKAIRDEGLDIEREVADFYSCFLAVVERSETPKERLQSLQLSDLQKRLSELSLQPVPARDSVCEAAALAEETDAWFRSLKYERETYEYVDADFCEWIITIPARRGFDRILVRCIAGKAGVAHVRDLQTIFEQKNTDEAWLISPRRISSAVKEVLKERAYKGLYCYTLDEVIDQIADFDQYLIWLETEITKRGIDQHYIPLGCSKEEIVMKWRRGSIVRR